jgi:serine/threonine protein kinase
MLQERLRIGRDGEADLVVSDQRIQRAHARVRMVKGEIVLSAEDGANVFVNGKRVPLFALQPGDRVDLLAPDAPNPQRLVFENRLHGAFVPPGTSLVEAWLAQPAYASGSDGPERFGVAAGGVPATGATVPGIDPGTGARLAVRVGPPLLGIEVERSMLVAARLAGGPHPAVAHVLDAGVVPSPKGPRTWCAMRWVEGGSAADLVGPVPQTPGRVLRALVPVAYALAWLHRRGLVHRDVAPGNVLLRANGRGVLIDFDQMRLLGTAAPAGRGVIGTPGFVAPEEVLEGTPTIRPAVDVYGLCAVAFALLTGRPPADGADVLETVARSAKPPPRPRDLGVEVPEPLEDLLAEGLAGDPAQRPSAADLARRLEAVRVSFATEES